MVFNDAPSLGNSLMGIIFIGDIPPNYQGLISKNTLYFSKFCRVIETLEDFEQCLTFINQQDVSVAKIVFDINFCGGLGVTCMERLALSAKGYTPTNKTFNLPFIECSCDNVHMDGARAIERINSFMTL